jgi:hypothetical protein
MVSHLSAFRVSDDHRDSVDIDDVVSSAKAVVTEVFGPFGLRPGRQTEKTTSHQIPQSSARQEEGRDP